MTPGPEYSEEDIALTGEYCLGLLPPEEASAFETRLLHEPALRRLVVEWDEGLAPLADDLAEVAPPAHLQKRIESTLFAADRPRRSWSLIGALSGAVAAALVVLAVLFVDPFGPSLPSHRADIVADDATMRISASLHGDTGALELVRLAGAAPPGRSLELWIIPQDAPAPISLGVLSEGETTSVTLAPELLAQLDGALLAVTDEPPGGSPSGLPTGSILASGPISPLTVEG